MNNSSSVFLAMLFSFTLSACGAGAGIEGPFEVRGYTVPHVDNPPTADAGPDQSVIEGDLVTLDGNGHDDEWGATLVWRQISGPPVHLTGSLPHRQTFVAPPVSQRTTLRFRISVTDSAGQTASDEMSVFVNPASQASKLVLLDFEGLSDGPFPVEYVPLDVDYSAECVVFRNLETTDASKSPEYRRFVPENTVVWDNDRIYNPPPETTFNVTVDFTEPVARVMADVYVESGASVTLRAFGDDGQQLGSATSNVSTDCCAVKTGTVALADVGWIHKVVFESSAPQISAAAIDNLLFERRTACH